MPGVAVYLSIDEPVRAECVGPGATGQRFIAIRFGTCTVYLAGYDDANARRALDLAESLTVAVQTITREIAADLMRVRATVPEPQGPPS